MLSIKKRISLKLKKIFYGNNLQKIGECTGSDKVYGHNYIPIYQDYFKTIRKDKLKFLEIGIGGYEDPNAGGESLHMWSEYFPNSQIIGADLFEKDLKLPKNIKTILLDQSDEGQIAEVGRKYGPFDIIIDDGSHDSSHIIKTFNTLFKNMNNNGLYFVEDTQTAYWNKFGGSEDCDETRSTYFFKQLTDGLNHMEFLNQDYLPSYFDKNIKSIHFYHNLIVIKKGNNDQNSLFVKNGQLLL